MLKASSDDEEHIISNYTRVPPTHATPVRRALDETKICPEIVSSPRRNAKVSSVIFERVHRKSVKV